MAKINVLQRNVAELIAAGEVIDRPASLIKEIVENSIDAGATSITVEVMNGGITFMRVTDNGCGIAPDEIPTAFLRHATSKLSTEDDLESIGTMGFRGEALASIAAVAKVEMLSKEKDRPLGCSYKIEGGEEISHSETGCPDGTTIIVRDLFFNTPARLKFLKKDVSEGNAIQAIVDKLALIHPEISFRFIRDNKPVRITSGDNNMYSSIYSVLGSQFALSLVPVDYTSGGVRVRGYISSPNFCKGNRTLQYFYVNRRYIRSSALVAAVESGYRNCLMVGKFPACILNIEIPKDTVDVNVHPAKTEVKFSNDNLIFDTVYFAVKNAILNADNKKEVIVERQPVLDMPPSEPAESIDSSKIKFSSSVKTFSRAGLEYTKKPPVYNTKEQFPDVIIDESDQQKSEIFAPKPEKSYQYIKQQVIKESPRVVEEISLVPKSESITVIGELFKTYIACQADDQFVLIDKHAAHERIQFETLKKDLIASSQILAESVIVTLDSEHAEAIGNAHDALMEVGFDCILTDTNRVEVVAMPSMLSNSDLHLIIGEISAILLNNSSDLTVIFDDILHSIACKSSIRANDNNDIDDLTRLANAVWLNKEIRFCPHGRPIILTLNRSEIEKMFKRK